MALAGVTATWVFALSEGPHLAIAAPLKPPAPATEVLGAQPIYREIKDWVLACDNTRACFAKYVSADDGASDGGYLSIAREAGPDAKLIVSIEKYDDNGVPDPRSLRVDGRAVTGAFPWRINSKEQTAQLDGGAALRFVRSISDGRSLSYTTGRDRSSVSLSGMKAVLLAMDEGQGRLDTATALIRVGGKPSSVVFAAVPVPVIHAAPQPQALADAPRFAAQVRRSQSALLKRHDCEADMIREDRAFALNRDEVLVLLGCLQAAYQESALVLEAPRDAPDKARLLVLPTEPTVTAAASQDYAGEYNVVDGWDPKTSTLYQSAKGRGLADCGSSTGWTFDGRSFQVSRYNALGRCGGGPPGDWPTIYRTQVVPAR